MTALNKNLALQLQHCLTLARSIETHSEAQQKFEQLRECISEQNPELLSLIELLWQETIAAYRSVGFWQKMSDVEKEMASNMMETMTQMRQNYLRLMQEM
ncbi:MAG: hypothetical protein WBA13_14610 [Microcoleaceae cyanobacterium]